MKLGFPKQYKLLLDKANWTKERKNGLIRHIVGLVGGLLVGFGFMNHEDVLALQSLIPELIGLVMGIWAIFSSFISPEKDPETIGTINEIKKAPSDAKVSDVLKKVVPLVLLALFASIYSFAQVDLELGFAAKYSYQNYAQSNQYALGGELQIIGKNEKGLTGRFALDYNQVYASSFNTNLYPHPAYSQVEIGIGKQFNKLTLLGLLGDMSTADRLPQNTMYLGAELLYEIQRDAPAAFSIFGRYKRSFGENEYINRERNVVEVGMVLTFDDSIFDKKEALPAVYDAGSGTTQRFKFN